MAKKNFAKKKGVGSDNDFTHYPTTTLYILYIAKYRGFLKTQLLCHVFV